MVNMQTERINAFPTCNRGAIGQTAGAIPIGELPIYRLGNDDTPRELNIFVYMNFNEHNNQAVHNM